MGMQLWSRMVPSLRRLHICPPAEPLPLCDLLRHASLKAGGWQSPEDKQREAAFLSHHRVVHGSERHQYGGKRPLLPSERKDDGGKSASEEEDDDAACVQTEPSASAAKRARF